MTASKSAVVSANPGAPGFRLDVSLGPTLGGIPKIQVKAKLKAKAKMARFGANTRSTGETRLAGSLLARGRRPRRGAHQEGRRIGAEAEHAAVVVVALAAPAGLGLAAGRARLVAPG